MTQFIPLLRIGPKKIIQNKEKFICEYTDYHRSRYLEGI